MMNDEQLAALQAIYDRDGNLKASTVLAEATPPDAPCHSLFEWDVEKAAREFNLDIARQICRTVVISHDGLAERLVNVPSIRREGEESQEGYYQFPGVMVQDEHDRAMGQALSALHAAHENVDVLAKGPKGSPNLRKALKGIKRAQDLLESERQGPAS